MDNEKNDKRARRSDSRRSGRGRAGRLGRSSRSRSPGARGPRGASRSGRGSQRIASELGRSRGGRGRVGGPRGRSRTSAHTTTMSHAGNDANGSAKSNGGKSNGRRSGGKQEEEQTPYPSYWSFEDCLALYAAKDPSIVRGKLRVLPSKDGKAFLACDRGSLARDVLIETPLEQNRALDGDMVFVELYPIEETDSMEELSKKMASTDLKDEQEPAVQTWQDDTVQRKLWNPIVPIKKLPNPTRQTTPQSKQRSGRVVLVVPPKATQPSELTPGDQNSVKTPKRTIVGRLVHMPRKGGKSVYFLTPNNKSLPQFVCPRDFSPQDSDGQSLYKAEYVYGSWRPDCTKPPCMNVQEMGKSCNVEDETLALLVEHDVNHGDFPPEVLKDVEEAVESGVTLESRSSQNIGWKPTPEMYARRRDYRQERIFTIDPTTAKDLDDALHVKELPDGRVEIGVHIADVSHFVQPGTAVNEEAMHRATTVYLVDRTVPMLPRPLCEVACSLNENVERLAFSCVWRMNMDGSLENTNKKKKCDDEVWYGRTVIKSCARLDYATAQNIIENKVATGEKASDMDESLWPASRRPSGKHSVDDVAADVRLMNRVAQARRRLRFQNGAVALNGVKLAFQLDTDGETPMLCAPYPIRDSNRLVEEFMLLANYLVAQRLITHAGGLALLRQHPPPLMEGIDRVVDVAKAVGFEIDPTSSQSLQSSLNRLGRECDDELVLQCVTEMLMMPMRPAEYFAAGSMEPEEWSHFALNIPFYTHFTSPIRRAPDVIVHRLLQATIDGEEAVKSFCMDESEIQSVANHCNDKRLASKRAQDRSDRVFLALYLKKKPLKGQLGVVLSVGEKTFNVYVPSIGASVLLFLDEHKDKLTFKPYTTSRDERRIKLTRKNSSSGSDWSSIDIEVFTKLKVSCHCKEKPPIDVKLKLEGPWTES